MCVFKISDVQILFRCKNLLNFFLLYYVTLRKNIVLSDQLTLGWLSLHRLYNKQNDDILKTLTINEKDAKVDKDVV